MDPKDLEGNNEKNNPGENEIKLKNLLPFVFRLGERTNTYWAIHTTVFLAITGWMISQRGAVFETDLKIFVTIIICLFYIIIGWAVIDAYEHVRLMIIDLKNLTEISRLPKIDKGYIGYLKNTNYKKSKIRSAIMCCVFLAILLVLIWSPWLWKDTGKIIG